MSADAEATGGGDDEGLAVPDEHPEWLTLDEGEEVQWVGEPASISLVPAVAWGLLLLPLLGLGLLVIASAYLNVKHTDYVVTNTTLYHKRGVLSTNIESVGVDRIQNTEYTQSFSGKQFGYGTIEVSTAGSSGSDVAFEAIEQPREVRDLVNRVSRAAGAGDGTGGRQDADDATAAASGGVDEQLLEELLAELRAVNESMTNVERLLREQRDAGGTRSPPSGSTGDPAPPDDPGSPDDGSEAGTASDFVSPGDDGSPLFGDDEG